MSSTCGRTDRHIAVTLLAFSLCKERGGITTGDFLSGYITLQVPITELLNEVTVNLVIKEEVIVGCAGVRRVHLLTHSDKPVAFGVVSERNTIGVDFLNLLANSLKLIPSGGNAQVVLIEEGLVVVKNLG